MLDFIKNSRILLIDFAVATVLILIFFIWVKKLVRPLFYFIVSLGFLIILFFFIYFKLILASIILSIALIALVMAICLLYQSDIRRLQFKKSSSGILVRPQKSKTEATMILYEELKESVLALSESKTGAIITIEKEINLDEYIKEGIILDCPVKKELLNTIFYSGTPLHDGAAVIRGNIICAASVYYQPTTKALRGRYGARHRAALGISEVTDSLTIVVSEETGRISFVEKGELETITHERFADTLAQKLNII